MGSFKALIKGNLKVSTDISRSIKLLLDTYWLARPTYQWRDAAELF